MLAVGVNDDVNLSSTSDQFVRDPCIPALAGHIIWIGVSLSQKLTSQEQVFRHDSAKYEWLLSGCTRPLSQDCFGVTGISVWSSTVCSKVYL